MWDILFTKRTRELVADPQTFLRGGWYSVELPDNIMILCLNGMYPFNKNL